MELKRRLLEERLLSLTEKAEALAAGDQAKSGSPPAAAGTSS